MAGTVSDVSMVSHHDLHVAGSWLGSRAAPSLLPLGDGGAPLVVDVEDLLLLLLGDAPLQRGPVAIWTVALKQIIFYTQHSSDFLQLSWFSNNCIREDLTI